MMTSTLTMTSGRNNSQRRLAAFSKHNAAIGYSGSPVLHSSDDLDPFSKTDHRKSDAEDSTIHRSASDYLSKLLSSRDFSNDLEGSPSTLSNSEANGFSYVPMKSGSSAPVSTRSSMQKGSSSQKKNNRTSHSHKHNKPAEVFRKDLISAMKLPDNSQLFHEEYWEMQDSWRIEWEKGVQVPVNQKAIPSRNVRNLSKETYGDFRMPRKMVKSSPEPGDKDVVDLNVLADSTCRYDLDDLDVLWLEEVNVERKLMGAKPLDEFSMEQIMEELEIQCHDNMQLAIQTKEGLGIEYDENVVCDVCRSLECEEGNEMVFCDGCNLCVHQACYGILKVPEGSWLCRPCALGIRGSAVCILCDRKGGAMKSTRSGNKWAHVSCALWIPEISIADEHRMEPITKVSHVPASRWALLCSICKQRMGACIQCSVKNCVTAYHVTCAFEAKLDMDADCGSSSSEDDPVILKSYCKKHSSRRKDSDEEDEQNEEEKRSQRHRRIMELEEEFYTQVKASAVASNLSVSEEIAERVIVYWTLKRRINFNKPLITPRHEEDTALAEAAASNLQRRLRMFTHLRQDLERVRNLCYMIGRREKTKRATVKNMESVFLTQMKVLERRMCEEANYDSVRMVPFLKKFGKPEICELARKETLILEKSSDWSQTANDTDNNKSDSSKSKNEQKRAERKFSSDFSRVKAGTQVKSNAEKTDSSKSSDLLKNGLHPKVLASACQERDVLLRRNRRKSSNHESSSKEPIGQSSPRKRSHNSDSDFENLPSRYIAESKRSRLEKTSTGEPPASKTSIRNKAPSNKPELISTSALSSKTNRISTRKTRSGSVYSDASDANDTPINKRTSVPPEPMQQTNKITEPRLSLNESHLIVKWDSDKNDDNPDIVQKSTVGSKRSLSLTEEKVATSIKAGSHSEESDHDSSRRRTRSSRNDVKSQDAKNQQKKSSSGRTARRLSSSKAKNDSGALGLSRKSVSLDIEESEQGLRKHDSRREPPSKLLEHRRTSGEATSEDVSRSSKNFRRPSKEDDDGGYRGDIGESDSDVAGPSRHKTSLHRHRLSHKEDNLTKSTDTSEPYYGEGRMKSSPRKRRLKSRMQAEHKVPLVSFQGFKDLDDDAYSDETKTKISKTLPASNESNLFDEASPTAVQQERPTSLSEDTKPNLSDEVKVTDLPAEENVPEEQLEKSPSQTNIPDQEKTHQPEIQTKTPPESVTDLEKTGDQMTADTPSTSVDATVSSQNDPNPAFSHHLYSSAQSYPAAFYGSAMSMVDMNYLQQQNYFYQSQFYPYWAPPPPPPPPPDDVSPQHPTGSVELEDTGDQLAQDPNLSVNQLHAVSDALCNQLDNTSSQVPFYPIVSDFNILNPNMSEVHTQQSSIVMDESERAAKKKKKKSKKKKKKKKRKRKHSRVERDSNSDMFSSANSGSDEYCVAYCSTIVDSQPSAETERTSAEPDNSETVISDTSSMPPQNDKVSTLQNEPTAQSETHEESKLLLKIDKKLFASSSHVKSSGESESLDDDSNSTSGEKTKDKPFITPLKLKLCGQKSDRTLRGGLVAREYQILEPGASQSPESKSAVSSLDTEEKSSVESKSFVEAPRAKPLKSRIKSTKQSSKTTKSTPQKNSSKKYVPASNPTSRNTTNSGLPTTSIQQTSSGTTSELLSRIKPNQSNSIPERHWKKRKLHVHEASVTTSTASGGKPPVTVTTSSASGMKPQAPLIKDKNVLQAPPNTSSTATVTNHLKKLLPAEEAKSKRINHSSPSTNQNESPAPNSPAKSTKPVQRRKKGMDSSKSGSEKNSARSFQTSLPPVSPYKFTVSKTHQKKVAAAGTDSPDKAKDITSDAIKTCGEDPYEFSDFGEM